MPFQLLRDVGRGDGVKPPFRLKRALGAVIGLALLTGCQPGKETSAAAAAESAYAAPDRLVKLDDGRVINLRCRGRGSPTVILESGWGATSEAWSRVAPQIAPLTRVCAYDRAGYGFSDPGPLPRDGAAITRDLAEVLSLEKLRGPYVLVGHSAGALTARMMAARNVSQVRGMILLDGTPAQLRPSALVQGDGLDGIRRRLQRCLAVAETHPQPEAGDERWGDCLGDNLSAHEMQTRRNPAVWRNQLSELDEINGRTAAEVMRIGSLLQNIPLYVFTASATVERTTSIRLGEPISPWLLMQRELASQSQFGWQQTVLSSHLIMVDRPEIVVDAIREMVRVSRTHTPPAPLPADEKMPDIPELPVK